MAGDVQTGENRRYDVIDVDHVKRTSVLLYTVDSHAEGLESIQDLACTNTWEGERFVLDGDDVVILSVEGYAVHGYRLAPSMEAA